MQLSQLFPDSLADGLGISAQGQTEPAQERKRVLAKSRIWLQNTHKTSIHRNTALIDNFTQISSQKYS